MNHMNLTKKNLRMNGEDNFFLAVLLKWYLPIFKAKKAWIRCWKEVLNCLFSHFCIVPFMYTYLIQKVENICQLWFWRPLQVQVGLTLQFLHLKARIIIPKKSTTLKGTLHFFMEINSYLFYNKKYLCLNLANLYVA